MSGSGMGFNGKLYIGIESRNVRDVTTDFSGDEVDDSSRDDEGWASTAIGVKKCTINFQMVRKANDTVWGTVKTAFKASSKIDNVRAVDALGDTVVGSFKVSKISRAEPLNGVAMADVTLVGQGKPTWE